MNFLDPYNPFPDFTFFRRHRNPNYTWGLFGEDLPLRIAASKGLEIVRPLGCGTFGCSYLLVDSRVLKLTRQHQEIDAAEKIYKGVYVHDMLPRIDAVWREGQLGCIIREELEDLEVVESEWFNVATLELEDALVEHHRDPDAVIDHMTEFMSNEPGNHEDELLVEQRLEFALDSLRQGIILSHDLEQVNWGVRADGQVVLRDLGSVRYL